MKRVLITGGAKRIGAGLSRFFAGHGWHVTIHYNSSSAAADALKAEIEGGGGRVDLLQADLRDEAAVSGVFAGFFAANSLDLVIHNASVFRHDFPDAIDSGIFTDSMRVNLFAPVKISELYARGTVPDQGCIINILDNKVVALNPDFFSYTLAKYALSGATEMQAMAFAPRIRVAGIAPGITLPSGEQTQADFDNTHGISPTGQGCTVEDICRAALFIATTPAYNGQVLTLDGGQALMKLGRDVAFLGEPNV